MSMITELIRNIQVIAAVVILLLLAFCGIGIYLFRFKKRTVKDQASDYSSYNRKEVVSYIRFDDVADEMLVADGGKRFIGAIKCQGFSFAEAEPEEKLQTIRGYITFINVMNGPVQYRQSARDVNLDALIESYRKQATALQEKRFTLNLDYTEMKAESESPELSPEDYDIYYDKLKQMQREMTSLDYQIRQLEAQVQYMYAISGDRAGAQREEIYVFDWQYNPVDFSSQELKEIEVYQRAEAQLKAKANAYISALRNCGVHAKRMKGVEILEEIRRYTHPVSAAKDTADDIVRSAYDSICVTSQSLQQLENEVNKRIVEEIARATGIPEGGAG